jgi:predicted dehydrogenase
MADVGPTGRDEVDAALARLEEAISRLDWKWRLFFMGSPDQKYPPDRETADLARWIRQFSTRYTLRVAQQFAFSNLAYRFNSLRERWNKWLHIMETQGRRAVLEAMGVHNPQASRQAMQASEARSASTAPAETPPLEDPYERLYQDFVQAYRQVGQDIRLDKDRFRQQVEAQAQAIRQRVGDRPLEFYVTIEQGRPKIKARVVAER